MRLPEVMSQTGMSRSWIYQAIQARVFPAPIKLGRASCWDAESIQTFLRDRMVESAPTSQEEGE